MTAPDLEKLEALARAVVWQRYRGNGPLICDEEVVNALASEITGLVSDDDPMIVALWLLLEIKALRAVEAAAREVVRRSYEDQEIEAMHVALAALDTSRAAREGTK